MEPGVFLRKLQSLNRELRIFCGDEDNRPAGLWLHHNGDYIEICGVDKNAVPEHCEYHPVTGRIRKSGWRRVLKILLEKGLVNKREAQKTFNTRLDYFTPMKLERGIILRELDEAKQIGERESIKIAGKPVPNYYRWQDLVEIHRHREQLKGKF